MIKLLITLRSPADIETARATGAEVLATYPSSLLVRADDGQRQAIAQAGLEAVPLPEPPIQVAGTSFEFASAVLADEHEPVAVDPNRTAYYIVKLVGPPSGDWLAAIRALGATIHGTLPGYSLLIGILPARLPELQAQPWVEGVTPYRPAMKVSPKLRGAPRELDTGGLAVLSMGEAEPEARQQVEISLFPGESAVDIAARVRAQGGTVLGETPQAVTAVVPAQAIEALANEPGVQAILPHVFPDFHNDRATAAMGAPANRVFGDLTLRGAGQIVGVGDSGIDTGNAATIHPDLAGRIVNIVSFPTNSVFAPYANDPPGNDDGPADTNSAHGTHVAGSVLGSGAAATAAGSTTVPQGMAPEARIYLQAVEQRVNWKTLAQLSAAGLAPFSPVWPPPAASLWGLPDDLANLFGPAYAAGARIHTNSWGANDAGQYSIRSRQVDQFMWNNRDMLILFSAGNAGRDNNGNGVIDPDSIGSPGTAKNCVTVGASENNRPAGSTPTPAFDVTWDHYPPGGVPRYPALATAGHVSDNINGMAAFSSRGPTDDGRIKPDVAAPGTNILSVRSSVAGPNPLWGDLAPADPLRGRYCWSGGTSMSTPLVAGAAALIRQHLVQQRGHVQPGVKPSGALIKAILVNGAMPMTGQFPGEIPAGQNNVCGFGRIDVAGAVTPGTLQQTLFADEPEYAVETGQIRVFEVQPVDTGGPLKVTLVWTDAPAPAGTGGLVNQLYLQVRRPDGTLVGGDVSAFPLATNNVQQVMIAAPAAGTYEIRVHGLVVTQQAPGAAGGPNPRQDFALAVSNALGLSVQPVSIAQAIDTTGSMAVFGYMDPARERAAQLLDFLRINDKVSITEFSQRAGVPPARTPYPLRLLGRFAPDWSDAHTAIGGLSAAGTTPIGAGLLEAWNQLDMEPAARPRAIVLLSDGLNNVPPDPLSAVASIPSEVPIFAIALGPAGSTPTLQAIAGSRPNGAYFAVESDEDIHRLHEIYAQVQALASGGAPLGLTADSAGAGEERRHELPVEPGVAEASFTLSWSGAAEAELAVAGPDGQSYGAGTAATFERRSDGLHLVRVAVPKPGTWVLLVRNRGNQPARYTLAATVQSPLRLAAGVATIGDRSLGLVARLRRGERPWNDAKVVARVTAPGRSRATVLAESGDKVRAIQLPPELDEPGLSEDDRLAMQFALFARGFAGEPGGLYRRTTVEVELTPHGDGSWTGEAPAASGGNATVEFIATGKIDGVAWQRRAGFSARLPDPAVPAVELRIGAISLKRLKRSVRLTAEVLDGSGPATPAEGTDVSVTVERAARPPLVRRMGYNSRTKRYSTSTRSKLSPPLRLTVRATQQGAVAERSEEVR